MAKQNRRRTATAMPVAAAAASAPVPRLYECHVAQKHPICSRNATARLLHAPREKARSRAARQRQADTSVHEMPRSGVQQANKR